MTIYAPKCINLNSQRAITLKRDLVLQIFTLVYEAQSYERVVVQEYKIGL
jgi:hypothetical protein